MSLENIKKQFISIYNKEADSVFRYCLLRVSSREHSLDISQEAFLRLWKAMYENKNIKNHRALLYTITRNLIIDWYRKKKSVSLESLDGESHGGEENDFLDKLVLEETSQEILELNADGRYLMEKIQDIDESYGQVVFMRFVMDLKPKEIAEILGESVNVISVRISRGVEKMRGLFGENK